jgi:hypothetical protein
MQQMPLSSSHRLFTRTEAVRAVEPFGIKCADLRNARLPDYIVGNRPHIAAADLAAFIAARLAVEVAA